jgi:hypothetical protein
MLIQFIILGSAMWDGTYAILVLNYWQNVLASNTVLWLPLFANLSISFTWEVGLVFIAARLLTALALSIVILIELGTGKDEEVVWHVYPFTRTK